ncbi:hypothetical protein OEZ86_006417 [Tetradesmus obliquus]|nr:hypothetical protein OEZ86_006417 [Tetradesmus obliquus]
MYGSSKGAAPAGVAHDSSRDSGALSLEGGVRRSSGGGGRAREPAGPLELDPCAPPLGSSKLSQPVLADVDYIVHRWSHRWQCDRQRQAATSPSPPAAASAAVAAATAHSPRTAAAAAAAGGTAEWVRPPEQLHLFGASPVSGLAGARRPGLP